MNRKLLVIAMVPLLVGFAGAMAFSGWSGSIQKNIYVSTATVRVYESVECIGAHITGYVLLTPVISYGGDPSSITPVVLDGQQGYNDWGYPPSACPTISYGGGGDPGALSLSGSDPIEFLGPEVGDAPTYSIGIQGLTPNDWIELLLLEHVTSTQGLGGADLQSTLTADNGVAATVTGPAPTGSLTPFTGLTPTGMEAAAAAGKWTWLADSVTSPCLTTYGLTSGGPLNVGAGFGKALGLDYCDSGPLGPTAMPAGTPPSATTPIVPTPGYPTDGWSYAIIVVGLDGSATGLSNSGMGLFGELTFQVTASAPT